MVQRGRLHKGTEEGGEGWGVDVDEQTEHVQSTEKASPCRRYIVNKGERRSWARKDWENKESSSSVAGTETVSREGCNLPGRKL